jgi:hypothetical protein
MGGDDDFVIDRIRKNERFRRLEEERRQQRLRKACGTTGSNTLIGGTTTDATALLTTKEADGNGNDDFQKPVGIYKTPYNNHNGPSIANVGSTVVERGSTKSLKNHTTSSNYKNDNKGVSFAMEVAPVSYDSVTHPMPKGIGRYIHTNRIMASSPSSSVTMSQPTPPDKSTTIMTQPLHRTIHMSNRITNKPPRKKISTLLDSSSDEDVNETMFETIEGIGKSDEKEKSQRRDSAGPRTSHNNTSQSGTNSSSAKQKLSVLDIESDDETEEILARAQKREEEKRRTQSMSSNPTTTTLASKNRTDVIKKRTRPRNPFTLMKEEDDCFENIYQVNKRNASRNLFQNDANNNSLWSDDSDDEEEKNRRNSKMAITTTKKRKSKGRKSPDNVHWNATANQTSLASKSAYVNNVDEIDRNGIDQEEEDDDRYDSQEPTHPYFHDPKFGPYDPPVPFVLRSSDSADDNEMDDTDQQNQTTDESHHSYQVPASINRYLPDYQRAGIEFMYRCGIVTKGGAILGDGTTLNACIGFSLFVFSCLNFLFSHYY